VRVLFDTNVLLDVLLDRKPHAPMSAAVTGRVERGDLVGCVSPTTITTVCFLVTKAIDRSAARRVISDLLGVFEVAAVGRQVLEIAAASRFTDFEDAVIHAAASQAGAEGIVTRNARDFRYAKMAVFSPEELETSLAARGS